MDLPKTFQFTIYKQEKINLLISAIDNIIVVNYNKNIWKNNLKLLLNTSLPKKNFG